MKQNQNLLIVSFLTEMIDVPSGCITTGKMCVVTLVASFGFDSFVKFDFTSKRN